MVPLISSASSTFASTVGFGWQDVIEFMATLIKLVIGTGLGILQSMLPWILVLAGIAGIVYFLYRAFVFFRH
jgi:hypothetical protein